MTVPNRPERQGEVNFRIRRLIGKILYNLAFPGGEIDRLIPTRLSDPRPLRRARSQSRQILYSVGRESGQVLLGFRAGL
jgi:hypothetical protein